MNSWDHAEILGQISSIFQVGAQIQTKETKILWILEKKWQNILQDFPGQWVVLFE